jgi:hypothetical protein
VKQRDYHALAAQHMSENDLQWKVTELATRLGYLIYHTHRSDRSQAGFPDLAIVGRGRYLMRELKRQGENPTKDQRLWISQLERAGVNVGVWRPADLLSGRVLAELGGESS